MVTRRKPPNRVARTQFNVWVPDDLRERFDEMVQTMEGLQRPGGGPMRRTDLVKCWIVWMLRQSRAEQVEWGRRYRAAFREYVDGVEASTAAATVPPSGHKSPRAGGPVDGASGDGLADEQRKPPARQIKALPKRLRRE